MNKLSSPHAYSELNQSNKKLEHHVLFKSEIPLVNTQALNPLDLLSLEQQKTRFEKAIFKDIPHARSFSKNHLNSVGIAKPESSFQTLAHFFRTEKNDALKHLENIHGLPLVDSIRTLISNLSMAEDSLDALKVIDDSNLHSVINRTGFPQGHARVNESHQAALVNKVDLVQAMVAEIVPKVSDLSGKQVVTIRLPFEGTKGLEVQLSRQGNELAMTVKTTNVDVYNQVVNARQDIQYSLESKLPNIMVRIDMDLTDQPDRQSKGYYVLPDDDES